MASSLAGRSFVITGGFSGIGLAVVRQLLSSSATVHALDLSQTPPKDLPTTNVHFYPSVDVTSRAGISKTFQSILAKSPEIHGVVNCAGVSPIATTLIEPDDVFEMAMAVNCRGTWNMTTEFMKHVQLQQRSVKSEPTLSIVNIGSTASLRGYRSFASYVCSKHAVLGLTRTWALDYAPLGVRVNLVAPGSTHTPMMQAQLDDNQVRGDAVRASTNAIPMERFAVPDEIASAVVFLLSTRSSYITGQVLAVNGGDF